MAPGRVRQYRGLSEGVLNGVKALLGTGSGVTLIREKPAEQVHQKRSGGELAGGGFEGRRASARSESRSGTVTADDPIAPHAHETVGTHAL